jgi:3-oxoadipate CoA-transferase alpha subunit
MAIDKRTATAAEAMAGVKDGAVVMIAGFAGAGVPNVLIEALLDAGPRGLTLVSNSATHRLSVTEKLISAGMVAKVICTAARGHEPGVLSAFEELWRVGKIELECVPQGNFSERIRAGGAGIPAFYTPVGHGTDLGAGKDVREFKGRPCVLEEAIIGDLALIRGDVGDRFGNIHYRYAQRNFSIAMATACTTTVAEVREAIDGAIPPEDVHLPSVFVNHVVAVGGTP